MLRGGVKGPGGRDAAGEIDKSCRSDQDALRVYVSESIQKNGELLSLSALVSTRYPNPLSRRLAARDGSELCTRRHRQHSSEVRNLSGLASLERMIGGWSPRRALVLSHQERVAQAGPLEHTTV
ncbi:hypothetical protein Bbelb_124810 [Branchiostoma belcheri]|nr:hypothetical protein Bbelb_124810 [Branchiostoma belcheri]